MAHKVMRDVATGAKGTPERQEGSYEFLERDNKAETFSLVNADCAVKRDGDGRIVVSFHTDAAFASVADLLWKAHTVQSDTVQRLALKGKSTSRTAHDLGI